MTNDRRPHNSRRFLSADGLVETLRNRLQYVEDPRRQSHQTFPMVDTLIIDDVSFPGRPDSADLLSVVLSGTGEGGPSPQSVGTDAQRGLIICIQHGFLVIPMACTDTWHWN